MGRIQESINKKRKEDIALGTQAAQLINHPIIVNFFEHEYVNITAAFWALETDATQAKFIALRAYLGAVKTLETRLIQYVEAGKTGILKNDLNL